MKKLNLLFAFFLTIAAMAQEKQIAFFPEANITSINNKYAEKKALFTQYQNFIEANLFETDSNHFTVEISYKKEGMMYKDRLHMNYTEKEAYVKELKEKIYFTENELKAGQNKNQEVKIVDHSGKPHLLVGSTAMGLGFYGWAVPSFLNIENEKAAVASYMFTAAGSYLIPAWGTKLKDVTEAQASFAFYGQTRGLLHGYLLSNLFVKDYEYVYDEDNYEEYWENTQRRRRLKLTYTTLGSVAGGVAGIKLARKWDFDNGGISMMQMWGDVGSLGGLAISHLTGMIDYDSDNAKLASATIVASSAAGLIAGKKFAESFNYTSGDAILYRSSIVIGMIVPFTFMTYFEPDNEKFYTASAVIGTVGGAYLGWKYTKDHDFTTVQGVMVSLGELAGALVGTGLGYLIAEDNGKVILTGTTIGAVAGFKILHNKYKNMNIADNSKVDLQLSINPASLLLSQKVNSSSQHISGGLVNLNVTF